MSVINISCPNHPSIQQAFRVLMDLVGAPWKFSMDRDADIYYGPHSPPTSCRIIISYFPNDPAILELQWEK